MSYASWPNLFVEITKLIMTRPTTNLLMHKVIILFLFSLNHTFGFDNEKYTNHQLVKNISNMVVTMDVKSHQSEADLNFKKQTQRSSNKTLDLIFMHIQ